MSELRERLKNVRRVIIKCGTTVVSHSDGYVALGRIGSVVEQISHLMKSGKQVLLVTSGAVGVGRQRLRHQKLLGTTVRAHIAGTPQEELDSRACAAAGQSGLMALYETMFAVHDVQCAQILVTDADFSSQIRRRNLHQTVEQLLAVRVLPILNENDVITPRTASLVDEKNKIFWDNDSLASLVAVEMGFDLLVMLSDVDGLYAQPPQPGIPQDPIETYQADSVYTIGEKSRIGRGGMQAKVDAAWGAVERGVKYVVIASGYKPNTIQKVVEGQMIGTLFTKQPIESSSPNQSPSLIADSARNAARNIIKVPMEARVKALHLIADGLISNQDRILKANSEDIASAATLNVNESARARLKMTTAKLKVLADGIRDIANGPELVGKTLKKTQISEELILEQITCPIGVLLVVFESRPDVLPQIAALAIRSANAVILKGGKESIQTLRELSSIVNSAISQAIGPSMTPLVTMIEGRKLVASLLKLPNAIDLCIPRGSAQLVKEMQAMSRVPVMGHAEGVCHLYIDAEADMDFAIRIALDAKCDYPAACNATETILVHKKFLADNAVSKLIAQLRNHGVEVFGGPKAAKLLSLPLQQNLSTEYGRLAVTIEIVEDVNEAILHIAAFGSSHTEAIISNNKDTCERFLQATDSACVFANASTRFADGYRFGLGAEVGISTGKIHARGPVGIEGLLTSKWILRSTSKKGHTVGDFTSGGSVYTHKPLPIVEGQVQQKSKL